MTFQVIQDNAHGKVSFDFGTITFEYVVEVDDAAWHAIWVLASQIARERYADERDHIEWIDLGGEGG